MKIGQQTDNSIEQLFNKKTMVGEIIMTTSFCEHWAQAIEKEVHTEKASDFVQSYVTYQINYLRGKLTI